MTNKLPDRRKKGFMDYAIAATSGLTAMLLFALLTGGIVFLRDYDQTQTNIKSDIKHIATDKYVYLKERIQKNDEKINIINDSYKTSDREILLEIAKLRNDNLQLFNSLKDSISKSYNNLVTDVAIIRKDISYLVKEKKGI